MVDFAARYVLTHIPETVDCPSACRQDDSAFGYKHSDGTKYMGQWKNGKRHGRGCVKFACIVNGRRGKCAYKGDWKDGMRDGDGELLYIDDTKMFSRTVVVYRGRWEKGRRQGKGSDVTEEGFGYEGEWVYDCRHGEGTLRVEGDGVYRGVFRNHCMEGVGVWTGEDGSVYEGCFKGGKRHGHGKLVQSGWVYEGGWESGKLCGKCTIHMPSEGGGQAVKSTWFLDNRETTLENLVRMYVKTWGRGVRVSVKMPGILMREKEFVVAALSRKLTEGFVTRIHGRLRTDADVLVAVAGEGDRALETIGRNTVRRCVERPDGGALMERIVRRNADMWWYLRRLVVHTERTRELEAMEADAHVPYHRRSGRRYRSCDAWAAYSRLDVATVMGVTPEQAPGRVLLPNDLLIKIGQLIDGAMVSHQWHGVWAAPCVHRGKRHRT
tara:strand:+ start:522 stop:1835 length:1314 start_codon:yes stop_codon:yes gene_type:complete